MENFGEFGEYAWIRQILLAIFLNTESVVDAVSECCYSGEWLVFRKYPIEYSMVLTNSSGRSMGNSARVIQLE